MFFLLKPNRFYVGMQVGTRWKNIARVVCRTAVPRFFSLLGLVDIWNPMHATHHQHQRWSPNLRLYILPWKEKILHRNTLHYLILMRAFQVDLPEYPITSSICSLNTCSYHSLHIILPAHFPPHNVFIVSSKAERLHN